ncbi:MAG: PEP-CTERM sorting domain-containing protein [Alcanivoracaceae bacterium]|jgi:hypothetical protein|nr:PEP-CTERM sorting domain-containing protein [Alcanivoracaceae bacterium]
MKYLSHLAAIMFAATFSNAASAVMIDFESVPSPGTSSFTVGDVTFTDSMPAGTALQVADFGHQSDGRGLGVFGDDASRLQLTFAGIYDFLSFDFGNDNPGFGDPFGQMHLDLYLDGMLTGAFALTANWDDIMNQTLTGTGLFNYAEIYYDTNLIEVIDNLEYRLDGVVAVPEPSSLMLLAMALAGIGFTSRRRNS